MEGITGSILLLCLISLTSANKSPSIDTEIYHVCEDTPIGAYAFTINASDPENDRLTYKLTGPNAVLFSVNENTGEVSVKRQLDRESTPSIEFGVVVSDGSNNTPGTLLIVIDDANDNKPVFVKAEYDTKIAENAPIGTTLFKAEATEADTGSAFVIRYSIDEVTPSEGFSLFSIVPFTGDVKLNGNLNYTELSTFYRLKINATDGGGQCYYNVTNFQSSSVFSFVTVVDVPDLDPQFLGVPYIEKVEENSAPGTEVLKVTAMDQDIGVNDNIIYSIENSTVNGLFKISPNNGIISVLSPIDRESTGDTVTLIVKATESKPNIHGVEAKTTAHVQINIIDVNDEKPEFYKCRDSDDDLSCVRANNFAGEVFEHSLGAIPINMTVRDLDKVAHTKLTLEGPDKDVFSVEPQFTSSDSIVQLLVKQPQKLDFEEKQQMVLQVIAEDQETHSPPSTATVTIEIKDTNDNSPKFPHNTYKLQVAEHSPVGTIVANITAEDPDTMDQGNITYRLLPDSILLYFDVEPQTGAVYVKNRTLLDREVRSLYSATLQAIDTDDKPGTTVLEITVTDINDQHPVINRDSYLEFVKEGGELKLKIEATDADDPDTENSKIVFAIVPSKYSDNFTIDPDTGVLTNSGELDREALDPDMDGRIELNITATDKGTPPLSTMVKVIINVEDVNDNKPEFEASSYKFSVKEGVKGAFVGSVYAEDLDQTTDFNRISFRIIEGSFGSFIIRTFAEERGYRGNITVDPDIELDYESNRKHFKLRVEATDLEQKTAVKDVEVEVLDVNDERPEFKPPSPVVKVKENTTISEAIGNFTAQDKDGNHSLIYELESINCRCNGSLAPCDYVILEPTGEVRLNPEHVLDYELCDQVWVEAQVVDKHTEKGENNSVTTERMEIIIEDINDNTPEFIYSDSVYVVVSESASKGTSVAGVTATDRDSGVNKQIEFKVTSVLFENTMNQTTTQRMLFEAVTTQQRDVYVGIIQTTEVLDLELKGKYLVTVSATDTGDLSTNTVLEIFTVDKSYKVVLRFVSTQAEVEKNLGTIIRALTAATKAAVEVVSIGPDSSEETRAGGSIMEAYFVYSNGSALASNEVEKMLSDPEHFPVLGQLGLTYIGQSSVQNPEVDPLQYILLGIVGGLVIVMAVLTTSLVCTRRNYRRKLKAAKAMNSASMVTSDNQKGGAVVPGTNKYTMEGANPVLNLNFDTAMVLDLDEECSDVDKVSLNSLDYSDDMSEKNSQPTMNMILEEEEDNELPDYIEPLGAALAQQGQKKGSNNVHMGFTNPAFSTTDL
eukprot:superscaffoldBa00000370_g4166